MPNSVMKVSNNYTREYKRRNSINMTEQTTMLEISQTIPKTKKRNISGYKYHIIVGALIIIILFTWIINIPQIKFFFREKILEKNLMRNFSETEPEADPKSQNPEPLYWRNEKNIHIKKVKREINSYTKEIKLSFDNKEDFIKRENPKISLVIPVYNKESFLLPLYKSIQNQSLKDIEIIFIDDNSSDGSVKLIEEFMKEDKRIVLIKHDTNYRTFYSRNEGVRKAKGKYILFIDPDD